MYVFTKFYDLYTDNTSVTLLGSPTAGESYTLEYSIGDPVALFEWVGPPDGRTPVTNSSSLTINSDSSTSWLQFRPLQQSHSGSYSCRATTQEGTVMLSELVEIRVNGISHYKKIFFTEQ